MRDITIHKTPFTELLFLGVIDRVLKIECEHSVELVRELICRLWDNENERGLYFEVIIKGIINPIGLGTHGEQVNAHTIADGQRVKLLKFFIIHVGGWEKVLPLHLPIYEKIANSPLVFSELVELLSIIIK